MAQNNKRQVKAAGKAKGKKDEESKDVSHSVMGDDEEDSVLEDAEGNEEEEILQKYGFKQIVELELILPTEEKELVLDYEMKFIDRNYQAKQSGGDAEYGEHPKPENLAEATSEYECNLADVVVFLKKCGYPLENCFVSFQSPVFSAYINCGLDPLPQSIKLTKEDFAQVNKGEQYRLQLKFIWGIRSEYKGEDEVGLVQPELEQQESTGGRSKRAVAAPSSSQQLDKENKRTKERTIGYIIEKVSQWRKLYNGYMDENHQLKRMSLEDAAEKVGVSKKSLDDYLSQLRQGRALGFNFNLHKNQKVGDLRQFVKVNQQKLQRGNSGSQQPQQIVGQQRREPELQRKGSQQGGAGSAKKVFKK